MNALAIVLVPGCLGAPSASQPTTVLRLSLGVLLFASVAACSSGDDEPVMDAAALTERLSSAGTDTVVVVGATTIEGAFSVPSGVTLVGSGREATTLRASTDAPAVTLAPGASLGRLSVIGAGGAAVEAVGDGSDGGSVTVEDVVIRVDVGQGLSLRALGGATLHRVEIEGPVTSDNATSVAPGADSTATATHGIVLDEVGRRESPAELREISVRGVGRFGLLLVGSHVALHDATVRENLGTAVMVHGGRVDAARLSVVRTLQGVQPLPAYAFLVAGGAEAGTEDLELLDNEGYGVVQDGGTAEHLRPVIIGNNEPGIWAQAQAATSIAGDGTEIAGNRLAGIVVVAPEQVSVRDARISATRIAPRIMGEIGEVRVGDGVHAIAEDGDGLTFEDLLMTENERVGLLLDLQEATADRAMFTRVTVDAPDDGFGAVAQTPAGPIALGEWGAAIERRGAALTADGAVGDRFDVVGLIAPMFLPRSE
jgi:hypothetical protein